MIRHTTAFSGVVVLSLLAGCTQEPGGHAVTAGGVISTAQAAGAKSGADKKETEKLQRYSRYVRRNGKALEIILPDGKLKVLRNIDEQGRESEFVKYEFVDYLTEIDHLLVAQYYYEGMAYSLIDRKYGSIQKIDDLPIFSQDRKHFITVSICDAFCPYRLQVWRRHDGGGWYEMVWSSSPYEYWASGSAKWLDNSAIEVTAELADPASSDPSKGKYNFIKVPRYLRLGQKGWTLTEK